MLKEEALTKEIIGAAIEVHREIGPGLLESAYHMCMCRELSLRGIQFEHELELPVVYKGVRLESSYKIDLLVEGLVIVEIKSVKQLLPVHEAQLLTYMRLTGKGIGLLINFYVTVLKDGLKRRVL